MITWEVKKLFKNKSIIISSIILLLLCGIMSLIKPELETENSYVDDKGKYTVDNRSETIIANEKLSYKIRGLKEIKSQNSMKNTDELTKKTSDMANLKLDKDSGKEYKDVSFYKVFNYRLSNMLA
ncbi:hypothetical protein QUV80_08185, partial [Paraclostridium benzoelyticum]|nr:hypothetical protein [Paraclostridium benzoelyticum]